MNTSLQRILLSAALLFSIGTMAQFPYTIYLSGQVTPCDSSSLVVIQTIQGTQPQITMTVPVDANCNYSAVLYVSSTFAWVQASTSCNNGTMVNAWDSAGFNTFLDTAIMVIDLNCSNTWWDCLGIMNGPNMPGTPCDDNNPMTTNDTWDSNCNCVGSVFTPPCEAAFTVQQAVNNNQLVPWSMTTTNQSSGAPPITYQWWMPDGSSSTSATPSFTFSAPGVYGICLTITADSGMCTSTLCDTIIVDSLGMISTGQVWYDCLGVLNGPDVPGAPCDDGDPNTVNDAWTANCNCVGSMLNPCNATFTVAQAFDSLNNMPIPFQLWVFTGNNNGQFQYFWDFGDGSTSTQQFPTHTYANNGPYLLCLTITGMGCTSTYCDTIAIDPNGIIVPGQGPVGFTINVINNGIVTDVQDLNGASNGLVVQPNPVRDVVELLFTLDGTAQTTIQVIDLAGKTVVDQQDRMNGGEHRVQLDLRDVRAGTYLVRVTAGEQMMTQRIVRTE